ncbi:MAG: hypothetical protein AAGB31_07495 [Bdellovibrio sp.]
MSRNIRWLLVVGASVLSLHCTHKETRTPAGMQDIVKNIEVNSLNQIMGGDSPWQQYRRTMKADFYVRGDKEYLSSTAKKALQEALAKSLGVESPEQGLAKLFAGNLKQSVVDNFVKTLRFYKLFNVGLQMELTFLPQGYERRNFDAELNSNQLVRLNETGQLSRKLAALDNSKMTTSIYNNAVLIPQQNDPSYIGGTITFYLEILDTNVRVKIPSLTKNGVKGFVRYRHYYRMNQPVQFQSNCDIYNIHAQSSRDSVPSFYTVDIYKNFNLENLIPTAETIEVWPGLIGATQDGRDELLPLSTSKEASSRLATFDVKVKQKKYEDIEFGVERLVYDVQSKKLDAEKSKVRVISFIRNRDVAPGQDEVLLQNVSRTFFNSCGSSLNKLLNVNAVMPGGVQ